MVHLHLVPQPLATSLMTITPSEKLLAQHYTHSGGDVLPHAVTQVPWAHRSLGLPRDGTMSV